MERHVLLSRRRGGWGNVLGCYVDSLGPGSAARMIAQLCSFFVYGLSRRSHCFGATAPFCAEPRCFARPRRFARPRTGSRWA